MATVNNPWGLFPRGGVPYGNAWLEYQAGLIAADFGREYLMEYGISPTVVANQNLQPISLASMERAVRELPRWVEEPPGQVCREFQHPDECEELTIKKNKTLHKLYFERFRK